MDITNLMNEYRECVRTLWNTHLLGKIDPDVVWGMIDQYDEICTKLFNIMVLRQIDRSECQKAMSYEQYPEPLLFLRVKPNPQSCVPILINREKEACGDWDYPFDWKNNAELDLRFIDCFDFALQSFREIEYYRVRVVGPSGFPELIGRDALILCKYAVVEVVSSEMDI